MDPHNESDEAEEDLLPIVSKDQPSSTLHDSSSTSIEASDDSETFYEMPTKSATVYPRLL
jgi:hypothetical protein